MNIINYCYYDENGNNLNLFKRFPIFPNIFVREKDLSKESLLKEVGKSCFHCEDDYDVTAINCLKSLINCDNILSTLRDPTYRYFKQEVNKKIKYFMNDFIMYSIEYPASESKEN